MNQCEKIGYLMGGYLYGDVAPEEADAVERHLAVCSRCRHDLETRRAALAALTPQAPTTQERERILGAIRSAAIRANTVGWRAMWHWRAFAIAGGAAAAAVLFVAGIWVGGQRASAPVNPPATIRAPVRIAAPGPAVVQEPEHRLPAPPERPAQKPPAAWRPPALASVCEEQPPLVAQAPRVVAPVPCGVDDIRLAAIEE